MKWKFWQHDNDNFYEPPRPPTRRTTLAELSERIIARQMRADPQYGLEVAEKIKKINPPAGNNQPTLIAQLQELAETRKLLKELADEEGGGGGTLKTIAEALTALPSVLEVLKQQQQPCP